MKLFMVSLTTYLYIEIILGLTIVLNVTPTDNYIGDEACRQGI